MEIHEEQYNRLTLVNSQMAALMDTLMDHEDVVHNKCNNLVTILDVLDEKISEAANLLHDMDKAGGWVNNGEKKNNQKEDARLFNLIESHALLEAGMDAYPDDVPDEVGDAVQKIEFEIASFKPATREGLIAKLKFVKAEFLKNEGLDDDELSLSNWGVLDLTRAGLTDAIAALHEKAA